MSKAWIFDFDGTLVHSEAAITQCFQRITQKLAPHRLDVAKQVLVGPPLRQTVAEILGDLEHPLIDEFVNAFIRMHDDGVLQHTTPYPSVHETLTNLHDQGQKMAIATNKRLAPTIKILEHLHWEQFFTFVECSDSEAVIRDKHQMIKTIVEKDDSFKDAYFVGDTVGDGLSANSSKLTFIKASYGYGRTEDWGIIKIFKSIDALHELLVI
ncbi:HAD family hydrolase [Methylophilaceae bacterium]|nr:HAD family hydrolase [Methylophilaceae bacterium]